MGHTLRPPAALFFQFLKCYSSNRGKIRFPSFFLLHQQEMGPVARQPPFLPSISTRTVCARSAASSSGLHVALRALSSRKVGFSLQTRYILLTAPRKREGGAAAQGRRGQNERTTNQRGLFKCNAGLGYVVNYVTFV